MLTANRTAGSNFAEKKITINQLTHSSHLKKHPQRCSAAAAAPGVTCQSRANYYLYATDAGLVPRPPCVTGLPLPARASPFRGFVYPAEACPAMADRRCVRADCPRPAAA